MTLFISKLLIACLFFFTNYIFKHQHNAHIIKYIYYHLFSYMFRRLLRHLQGELLCMLKKYSHVLRLH